MIVESPFPDVAIPDQSLPEFVLDGVADRGDKPAFIDTGTGREVTFAELPAQVDALAAGLSTRGFEHGDTFAIYAPNLPEYPVAFHGVTAVGGVVTTINPLYTVEELTRQLDDTEATYLLTVPPFADRAAEAAEATAVEEVFVLGESEIGTPFPVLFDTETDPPDVAVEPDDLAVLPYSSGTTGMPKGVELTHRNLVANLRQMSGVEPPEFDADDVSVGVLPFYHIYGMNVVMNFHIREGVTVVTVPKFELEPFLETLQEHSVTVAYLVPPIVLTLAQEPVVEEYDLSALSLIGSGAAPLSEEIATVCASRLDCLVKQGYGLTEASPTTHFTPRDPNRVRRGTVGPPLPNTECRVVDVETGEDLGPGEEGEILVRGPQVMRGYHDRPDATANAFEDDWLPTGDLGVVDEDGYLSVIDRVKELIKYKGYQVAPAELEELLIEEPPVTDAAVVPKPDKEAGEIPKAFVVSDGDIDTAAVKSSVAERVAPHKKIREMEVIDEIPKSPSGKILRRILIEEHVEQRDDSVRLGEPDTP
jgi:acyl-CoA synthetase (AMP-forming)/AMP-acid ligase II